MPTITNDTIKELMGVLHDTLEYLGDYADTYDDDNGEPAPNEAMLLEQAVNQVLTTLVLEQQRGLMPEPPTADHSVNIEEVEQRRKSKAQNMEPDFEQLIMDYGNARYAEGLAYGAAKAEAQHQLADFMAPSSERELNAVLARMVRLMDELEELRDNTKGLWS